ncbi:heat shock protein 81-1 [Enterocytozoon bieneusi H348]|nr:heat shock protein 81-1 [Enterocytozoon bieneusi H348]|eukprot:XP_001828044.1 heat shock protein 81-1 [Enterocytozoon bieneusi H348]
MCGNHENTEVNKETYEFGVEVPQLMNMFINSVYSSKELFLREAISNASDALTKLFDLKEQLDKEGYETEMYNNLKIEIIPDTENNTLIIRDNGIGMTKDDLRNYLGNIASSGTAKFRELLSEKGKDQNVEDLIGQFGLGFYSLFLVAKQVDVVTKNPRDRAYLWSSDGQSGYSIKEYDRPTEEGKHGTTIYLRLKDGEDEFLKSDKLIELVKKHSMYIKYPIGVETITETKDEKDAKEGEGENKDDVKEIEEDAGVSKKVKELKIVNSDIQVWKKKVSEVSEDDLKKFYKQISGDYDDYMAVESFHFEGIVDVKLLIFFPKRQKMNFFERQPEKANNIKIYNNNVFITDELPRDVVPEWMGFINAAVTSSDFQLNISREFLQGKSALKILKQKLPKCIASMIKNLQQKDKEQFDKFLKEFSKNVKLAVKETSDQIQMQFASFLRYPTNRSKDLISFDDYMKQIASTEKQILYLTGLSDKEVENSIYLDAYKDRVVLLMGDPADEIMLQGFKKYNDLSFQNVSAEGVLTVEGNEDPLNTEDEYAEFAKKVQEILSEKVEKVIVSRRFESVPASILTTKYGHSSTMEAIIRANATVENNMMVQMMLQMKKIFEINPDNSFIKKIKKEFDDGNTSKVEEYIKFLWESTAVGCGYAVENKTAFIRTMFDILSKQE